MSLYLTGKHSPRPSTRPILPRSLEPPATHPKVHIGAFTSTCRPLTSTATKPANRTLLGSLGDTAVDVVVVSVRMEAVLPFLPAGCGTVLPSIVNIPLFVLSRFAALSPSFPLSSPSSAKSARGGSPVFSGSMMSGRIGSPGKGYVIATSRLSCGKFARMPTTSSMIIDALPSTPAGGGSFRYRKSAAVRLLATILVKSAR